MADIRVPDLNRVIIAGRLTRDPEMKYLTSGHPVANASIANTRYYRTQEGERREETTFVDLQIWGKMAEFAAERLRKGRPVIVEGSLQSQEWEDRQTGQKRRRTLVRVDRISALDWDGQGDQQQPRAQSQRPAPAVRDGQADEEMPADDIPF